jgi:hypothetical protein
MPPVLQSCGGGAGKDSDDVVDSGLDGTTGSSGAGGSSGNPLCGNGEIDDNEQCDGSNLGGETCASLGEGDGTLMCLPNTCMFDVSMCTQVGGGSGGYGG